MVPGPTLGYRLWPHGHRAPLLRTAFGRPGWAIVSTHDDERTTYTWMDDEVFVDLQEDGCVVRLAHTQSLVDDEEELDYA